MRSSMDIDIMTLEDINSVLAKKYKRSYGGNLDRRLVVLKEEDSVGDEVVFFFLQGSPPKGYAIWSGGHRRIDFYDPHGKQFKSRYLQMGIKFD